MTFIFIETKLPSLLVFNLILKITTLNKKQEEMFDIHLYRHSTATSLGFQLDPKNNYTEKKQEELFNIHLCRNSTATSFGFQLDPKNNYTEKKTGGTF